MIELRKKQLKEEREEKNKRIRERLFSLPEFKRAENIVFYASKQEEAGEAQWIGLALEQGKKVYCPATVLEKKELRLCRVESVSELKPGAYGVLEPGLKDCVSPSKVDLVVVPGVAFDESGGRLGHGEGYFDRLLAKLRAPFIALAFEFQIVESVPVEEGDVRVQGIVTERRFVDCSANA